MARTTTNYGFNISEGSDLVNPLTDIFPNFEDIDTDLKSVSDDAIGTATELLTGTVHALTRADSDRDCIRFTATSNFTAGETFTVDGVQVTALTPDGQTLATGSYIIGSEVFAILKGTLLTVYVSPAKAKDSDLLDGHDSTYFAKDSDMTDAQNDISTMSAKVGTGVLDTTAQNCVGAINELNSSLTVSDSELNPWQSGMSGKMQYTRQGNVVSIRGLCTITSAQSVGTKLYAMPSSAPYVNANYKVGQLLMSNSDTSKHLGIKIEGRDLIVDTVGNIGEYWVDLEFVATNSEMP